MQFAAVNPCKVDGDCTAIPATPTCNVGAGVCTKTVDPPNAVCATVAANMSLTLGGECIQDCPTVADPTKMINVGGFHNVAGVCTADTTPPTSPTTDNACMPIKAGFTVNKTTQMCTADCATVTMGSHLLNGECVKDHDSIKKNADCTPHALARYSINAVTTECQIDCPDVT